MFISSLHQGSLTDDMVQHGVDMNTNLLTPDGFPRSDLDVAQIRTTRSRIIHLRNDYKELMNLIEKRLHEHFASIKDDDEESAPIPTDQSAPLPDSVPEVLEQPFAKVNSVVDDSPAATAGLKAGDLIRSFGYVNLSNHDNLRKVAECVQGNEGVSYLRTLLSFNSNCQLGKYELTGYTS